MNYEGSDALEDAFESVVRRVLYNEVSTFFPGVITTARPSTINPNVYVCDVLSSFLKFDLDTKTPYPTQILDVPIILPGRTNTFMIRPPMDPLSLTGASVGLIVSNNYLANWRKTGGAVAPTEGHKFYYADAVAMLGLYPDLQGWPTPPVVNTAEIQVLDGTFIKMGNQVADLVKIMRGILDVMTNIPQANGTTYGPASTSIGTPKTIAQLLVEIQTLTDSLT
ncbi:MAG: hypothetical protein K0U20_09135 [Proteobacteria bacterium]|nr:hypothetical protein [Pseudomonadota bacterium]